MEAEIANYEACLKEEVEKRKKFKVGDPSTVCSSALSEKMSSGVLMCLLSYRLMTSEGPTTMMNLSVPSYPCWLRKVRGFL